MNEAQRNEMKLKVAQHTGYATYHMTCDNLHTSMGELNVARQHLQQLIDDERDRAERREYENDIMECDEKSEVLADD